MRAIVRKWLKFGLWLLGLGSIIAVLNLCGIHLSDFTPERIRTYVLSFGWWAPVVYLVIYGQPVVPLPASVMLMAAGLAFGMLGGLALALATLTIRGCGQFLMARFCGREAIETLLRGRLARWDQRVGHVTFGTLLWIRMLAPVPYDIQNFSLGLSAVSFGTFVAATVVGAIPGGAVWVYLGQAVTSAAQLWKVGVAMAVIVGLWLIQRAVRRRRAQASSQRSPVAALSR
ncbi:MAG: TVP38/TMEM64 family protein [Candidatus Omnitrophica bacterium]|nr:TVP38/TMEM64 family protein [Candidatus Omnitrophota bacterium]